jgi:dihydroorotate dehydrogenase
VEDYETCLDKAYARASYVTINVSSPNTEGLRSLQEGDSLENLLSRLTAKRQILEQRHGKHVPLALKVAPDLDAAQVKTIAAAVRRHRIEAVIATNTSLSREGVEDMIHAREAGGLSGAPIRKRATEVLQLFRNELKNEAALIGAGGILSREDAMEKFSAGAALVQLYTGLIYRGPDLIAQCVP